MKRMLRRQKGIILVFSLVFLLLILLLSVSLVQQNRMQFLMVSNTQGQTDQIAAIENTLRATEKYIDSKRYEKGSYPNEAAGDKFICQTPGGFYSQLPPGELSGSDLNINLLNGSTVAITKAACITGVQLTENDCALPNNTYCNQPVAVTGNPCDVEIYTIAITMIDSTNNERSVVSRYAVSCTE